MRMYIARVPNRTSPPAILLRESFRQDGKVKSRTLANITSWAPERIEALDRALHGDFDHAALSEPTVGPVFGLLHVLKQVADQIGIGHALGCREIRATKTGALEVRPIFVQKASRTRGHVFCCMLALKLAREMEQRLRAAFGTTGDNPHAVTLPDAMAALSRLCLLNYPANKSGEVVTKLPHPNDAQRKILQALHVSLPRL